MVSIILAIVGGMMIVSGIGLRGLIHSFGNAICLLGFCFVLDAGIGWIFDFSDHKKVIIAGGILFVFSVVTAIWQLHVKFKEMQKKAEEQKKSDIS